MMRTTVALVFVLGASAEVPHWVQKKSALKVPSVSSMIKPMLSMHAQQTPNNRRLQAIMSEECVAACPGAKDMVTAMMGAAAGERRRLDGHEGGDDEAAAAMMKLMCDHMDAIKCAGDTPACQDTGEKQSEEDAAGTAMLECTCTCPKLLEGDKEICSDKEGTIGCMKKTSACSALTSQLNEKEVDLGCEFQSKGCAEKQEKMMDCVTMESLTTWGEKKCDSAIEEDTATCCPIAKKLVDCTDADCAAISMAMDQIKADGGDKDSKESVDGTTKMREACPDAGIPSKAAVAATASEGKLSSGESAAATSDFATPGQTVSMLGMAAVIAASLMA